MVPAAPVVMNDCTSSGIKLDQLNPPQGMQQLATSRCSRQENFPSFTAKMPREDGSEVPSNRWSEKSLHITVLKIKGHQKLQDETGTVHQNHRHQGSSKDDGICFLPKVPLMSERHEGTQKVEN